MKICAEFEQEKGGRWVARFQGVGELVGYGSTRHEAVVGLTVHALHVMADRVESGELEVENDSALDDLLGALLRVHTPNAETIAAFEEYERDGGKSFNSIEELMAELNADD